MKRIKGLLYASAIGDAKGAPFEKVPKKYWKEGASEAPTQYLDDDYQTEKGWLGYLITPGQVTDDTVLGLALLESIMEQTKKDEFKIFYNMKMLNNYAKKLAGLAGYPIGFGATMSKIIEKLSNNPPYEKYEYANSRYFKYIDWDRISDEHSIGGSSLTKWPVVLNTSCLGTVIKQTMTDCRITYSNPEAVKHAQFLNIMLSEMLYSRPKKEAYELAKKITKIELEERKELNEFTTPVILKKAVDAFMNTDSLCEALKTAILNSRDSDTAGYVTGLLAGVYYGFEAIPERLITGLKDDHSKKDLKTRLDKASKYFEEKLGIN